MKSDIPAREVLGLVRTTGRRAVDLATKAAFQGLSLAERGLRHWKAPFVKQYKRGGKFINDPRTGLGSFFLFAKECLRAPRSVGAICPSGPALAKAMAARVADGNGLVVELGAGTGVVTAALLRRGITPARLVVLERSEAMVTLLRRRFPQLTIVHGDAASLSDYLPKGAQVDCIVSSLPFVSIPEEIRTRIISQIKSLLQGGSLLQYTYLWAKESCLTRAGLTCVSTTTVWKNMPPARVMEFH